MKFKSWRDAYIFIRDYATFSCLNCQYGSSNLDVNDYHTDVEYTHVFCTKLIDMIRLDYQLVCDKWCKDNHGIDKRCNVWEISDEVLEILDNTDKEWTIEEIEELIHEKDIE